MLSLYVRFKLFPSTKALFVPHLAELMKTMAQEPIFVSAVLSEDSADADAVVLSEVWNGSQDEWLSRSPRKPPASYLAPIHGTNITFFTRYVMFGSLVLLSGRRTHTLRNGNSLRTRDGMEIAPGPLTVRRSGSLGRRLSCR
jgi:hypothetical protein